MRKAILFVLGLLSLVSVYAENLNADQVLPYDDKVITNGTCEFKCRMPARGFGTQITGIDFKNGVTYCSVFRLVATDRIIPNINANQENRVCAKEISGNVVAKDEVKNKDLNYKFEPLAYNSNSLTLSRFFGAMATLDPSVIDFEATKNTGQLQLQKGIELKGQIGGLFQANLSSVLFGGKDSQKPLTDGIAVSTADAFNKANLAYFAGLFNNMQEIYGYLQNLLFVVVGGYFLSAIGARKLQTYLERNDEATPREPYLHKFYVPLLAVFFFFAPIPENGGMNSTVIQNIIRFFTAESIAIADKAAAIGTSTYMQKLYATVGAMSVEGEAYTLKTIKDSEAEMKHSERVLREKCYQRFPNMEMGGMTAEAMKDHENIDINHLSGTPKDISMKTCVSVLNTYVQAKKSFQTAKNLKEVQDRFTAGENIDGSLSDNLKKINTLIQTRQDELGWINATIVPGTGIMVELQDDIINNKVQPASEEIANESINAAIENTTDGERKNILAAGKDIFLAEITNLLVYMTIPGASSIRDALNNGAQNILKVFENIPTIATKVKVGGVVASELLSVIFTAYFVSAMLEKVPVLIATVAGAIAFISYLVSLLKYYYISPFVVAYAITTKKYEKIISFLISGIAIFFKPVLIVIFIFLALFIHTLVQEFFIVFSIEQFAALKMGIENVWAAFSIGAIKALLKIFGCLASGYIMWKIIMSGPNWALKLLGIDGSQDEAITQSLSQKLESKTLMA
ncbi:hypothetical protein CCZ01_09655 [Helicobacter monodelphidis]|uniref:hypothetical protein n=1 Tax=Helicobacter sp. 15-1451 TaxID=2004995 RepID=UPI000DCE923F|nr:hypothetical protein [Helicobacter sp. 15-1451]RAX56393.1 hypothetical protein CCZ01_09655 [Helicobacter sp. 15-1451]